MSRRGPASRDPRFALGAGLLGAFIITLDTLIVSVSLPSIRADLHAGATGLQWIVDSYTLVFAALLLIAGSLTDRVGARRAYAADVVIFTASSAVCGFAPDTATLIGGRMMQGVGAAIMMPASVALISHAYSDPVRRARAIGIWAIGGSIGASAGPVIGGAVSLVSWRAIFLINVPAGLIALALLAGAARSPRSRVPLNPWGQLAVFFALGALTYVVIEGGAHGFSTPSVIVAAVVAAGAMIAFVATQVWSRHPVLPSEILRSRPVLICSFAGFAFIGAFFGLIFLFSIYLQEHLGLSSLQAGLVFFPMTALSVPVNAVAIRMAERLGPRIPIAVGLFIGTAGLVLLALIPEGMPAWALALCLLPAGLGGPLAMPPIIALLVNSVAPHRAGVATGLFNTSRQFGGALAVAAFGALIAGQTDIVDGMRASLAIAAVVLLLAAISTLFLRERPVGESIEVRAPAPLPAGPCD